MQRAGSDDELLPGGCGRGASLPSGERPTHPRTPPCTERATNIITSVWGGTQGAPKWVPGWCGRGGRGEGGDVPVPQVVEDILEVIKVSPQERESERIVEQIFDVPVLQVLEEIVDVPVSQVVEEILEVFTQAGVGVHRGADC